MHLIIQSIPHSITSHSSQSFHIINHHPSQAIANMVLIPQEDIQQCEDMCHFMTMLENKVLAPQAYPSPNAFMF